VLRQPDFGEQEDPLPNGWVSRFDQLSGEEYFFCAETEYLVFSREDLFRKKPATNSISSCRLGRGVFFARKRRAKLKIVSHVTRKL
jgi:hypothetical protein